MSLDSLTISPVIQFSPIELKKQVDGTISTCQVKSAKDLEKVKDEFVKTYQNLEKSRREFEEYKENPEKYKQILDTEKQNFEQWCLNRIERYKKNLEACNKEDSSHKLFKKIFFPKEMPEKILESPENVKKENKIKYKKLKEQARNLEKQILKEYGVNIHLGSRLGDKPNPNTEVILECLARIKQIGLGSQLKGTNIEISKAEDNIMKKKPAGGRYYNNLDIITLPKYKDLKLSRKKKEETENDRKYIYSVLISSKTAKEAKELIDSFRKNKSIPYLNKTLNKLEKDKYFENFNTIIDRKTEKYREMINKVLSGKDLSNEDKEALIKEQQSFRSRNVSGNFNIVTTPFHEFGHRLHYKYNPVRNFLCLHNKFTKEGEDLISREVSVYAASKLNEFVAEVFAGLITGDHYSDRIMSLYNKLGGIIPKSQLNKSINKTFLSNEEIIKQVNEFIHIPEIELKTDIKKLETQVLTWCKKDGIFEKFKQNPQKQKEILLADYKRIINHKKKENEEKYAKKAKIYNEQFADSSEFSRSTNHKIFKNVIFPRKYPDINLRSPENIKEENIKKYGDLGEKVQNLENKVSKEYGVNAHFASRLGDKPNPNVDVVLEMLKKAKEAGFSDNLKGLNIEMSKVGDYYTNKNLGYDSCLNTILIPKNIDLNEILKIEKECTINFPKDMYYILLNNDTAEKSKELLDKRIEKHKIIANTNIPNNNYSNFISSSRKKCIKMINKILSGKNLTHEDKTALIKEQQELAINDDIDHPVELLYEILACYLYDKLDKTKFLLASNKLIEFTPEQKHIVAREISLRTSNNCYEFIKQVFTGLMNGKKFSEDIMKLYTDLGGPVPKFSSKI